MFYFILSLSITTKQQGQPTHTKQHNTQPTPPHQAPHEYPFICVLIAYYPLSLYYTNHTQLTANIAFILYINKV